MSEIKNSFNIIFMISYLAVCHLKKQCKLYLENTFSNDKDAEQNMS